MKAYLHKYFFLIVLMALTTGVLGLSSCGSSSATPSVPTAPTCADVPSGSTVNGTNYNVATKHCSAETAGKWTALTVHIPLSGGAATLNATCDDVAPFANQAAFDASESGGGFSTNADYVVTSKCASGSTRGSTTKELFIWKLNP